MRGPRAPPLLASATRLSEPQISHPDNVRSDYDPAVPTVSVVVPSFARAPSLVRCLEALTLQTLPRDAFEVIVCDDGSSRPLEPAIAGLADRIALTVVRQRRSGPAAARNEGARRAKGRLLAFTDDDCVPAPDWLARIVARSDASPGHLIGGAIENILPRDPYAMATQLIMSSVYDYFSRHPTDHRFFSTTNLAVPTEQFWQIEGFSTSFARAAGEDYDFCARWHEAGLPSVYAPDAVVGHAHGHSLRSFLAQHFGYGRALLRVREGMARRQGRPRIQLEDPTFYRQLLTYPLRQGYGVRGIGYAALVILAQAATAAGAAIERMTTGDWERFRAASGERPSSKATSATR